MAAAQNLDSVWVVTNEQDIPVSAADLLAVEAYLNKREIAESGSFTLWERRPDIALSEFRAIVLRLLRPKQTHQVRWDLIWRANAAAIMFLDSNGSEYRVLAESPISITTENLRMLSFDEPAPLAQEYCLSKQRAFEVARRWLQTPTLPPSLPFVFVR